MRHVFESIAGIDCSLPRDFYIPDMGKNDAEISLGVKGHQFGYWKRGPFPYSTRVGFLQGAAHCEIFKIHNFYSMITTHEMGFEFMS